MTPRELILSKASDAKRVGKSWVARCPGHEDDRPSLSITEKASGDVLIHCFAGCSPEAVLACWGLTLFDLMPIRNGGSSRQSSNHLDGPRVRSVTITNTAPTRHDLASLAESYRTSINPARLGRLASRLGLTAESLQRLGIGWATDVCAWSLPMVDAAGVVLGIRLRLESGRKFSVTGGREGLFIPSDLPAAGELLITEGPTDCAALLDLGFAAVGRPSCIGGVRLLVELVRARKPADVVIVADGDGPGKRGAESLAGVLVLFVRRLRIIAPPDGVKDARAWRQAGATAADVRAAIGVAPIRKLRITAEGGQRTVRCD